MFDLKLNSTIQMLVDHELDRKTSVKILDDGNYQRPGVYLSIYLEASDYQTDKTEYMRVFMLFTGNTSVFYTTNFEPSIKDISNSLWINTSNHDSCWRSDGFSFLHKLQMEMCKRVNPNIAPIKLYTESKLSIGGTYPIEHCLVTFKDNIKEHYRYEIVNIEPIKKREEELNIITKDYR